MPSLLPLLDEEEAAEVAALYVRAGLPLPFEGRRPFRRLDPDIRHAELLGTSTKPGGATTSRHWATSMVSRMDSGRVRRTGLPLLQESPALKMTNMTISDPKTWTLAAAKAHLSEVVDSALKKGPQVITRRGRETVVVVAAEEWNRKVRRQGTLADFFAASPLHESGLEIERLEDGPRDLAL